MASTPRAAAQSLRASKSRANTRASSQQRATLARTAKLAGKSIQDLILDSAFKVAEQVLIDQRLFFASHTQYRKLLATLDRPAKPNAGLKRLFSKAPPWAAG